MFPQKIIIDTKKLLETYCVAMSTLPFYNEFINDDLISKLFDYIQDLDYAQGNVSEYAMEITDLLANRFRDDEIHILGKMIKDIGIAFIQQLKAMGAYDKNGACWYEFDCYLGNDIVLSKITQF